MCGIVGIITCGRPDHQALSRAQTLIAHRGPDDFGEGWWMHGLYSVGLASRRLSILDLTPSGHMPMSNEDGTIWLVYNGEVYNFQDLRRVLVEKGHRFRSNGDTEVLIHLYEDEGPEFIRKLNGIFAFGLWDSRKGILMLGRDRFGIKPIYYHQAGSSLWFSSEIKALFCFPEVKREVDHQAIDAALTFLGVPGTKTGFKDIYKLLPGHYLLWRDGQVQTYPYWDLEFSTNGKPVDEQQLEEEFRSLLERVVKRQMISDVPLGAFLSGGLDSSALVAMMARGTKKSVETYTIVYRQQDQKWERAGSEAPYARAVAQSVGASHHEIVVEPNIVDLLPKIAWHLDEPIGDPASISTYLICKSAPDHLKVLLAGQGADEVLAGYHFYTAHRHSDWYGHIPPFVGAPLAHGLQAMLLGLSRVAPMDWPGRVLAIRRYADLITRNAYLPPSLRHTAYHAYFTPERKHSLYSTEFKQAIGNSDSALYYRQVFDNHPNQPMLNRYLFVDMRTHLPDLILNYTDKLGMAASKELRVPFLDNELVEFASRLPLGLKLNGTTGKYILRRAMRGILPEPILKRRKMPFGAPVRGWLRQDLRPMIDDLLSEYAVRRRGYFEYEAVRQIVEDSRKSLGTSAHQVWALLMLELWHRIFIDRTIIP